MLARRRYGATARLAARVGSWLLRALRRLLVLAVALAIVVVLVRADGDPRANRASTMSSP